MKTRLLILSTKIIYILCRILGKNGSVYPGRVLFRRDIHVLNKIKYPKYVIGVTGSSGKGSTTNMIYKILSKSGYKVVYNESGSNAVRGIYTCIMRHTSFFTKKVKADILLLELDERHISLAFPQNELTHLVITNITRDQPARNGYPDLILDAIKNAIDDSVHLIINADDPIVNKIKLSHKGKITNYGINKSKYSKDKDNYLSLDQVYCPICFKKLKYSFYHYGHLGNYNCINKHFERGNLDYCASNINLDNNTIKINGNYIRLDRGVFFAIYYSLSAYALCDSLNIISKEIIINVFNENKEKSKRMLDYNYNNKNITLIESKNENNLSYLQSLNYIVSSSGMKDVVVGFDNVSRRYKDNDISWLYDVEFELLNDPSIQNIYCIGRFRFDVAARLSYANINSNKLIIMDNIVKLLEALNKGNSKNIYTMLCFDMTEELTKVIKGDKND